MFDSIVNAAQTVYHLNQLPPNGATSADQVQMHLDRLRELERTR